MYQRGNIHITGQFFFFTHKASLRRLGGDIAQRGEVRAVPNAAASMAVFLPDHPGYVNDSLTCPPAGSLTRSYTPGVVLYACYRRACYRRAARSRWERAQAPG